MNLSKTEQETIILYNQEETLCECYTHNASLIRQLKKMASEGKPVEVVREEDGLGEFIFPKKWVKIRSPRNLSEEERARLSALAKKNFGKE